MSVRQLRTTPNKTCGGEFTRRRNACKLKIIHEMQTRRTFLKRSLGAAGAALALSTTSFSEDAAPQILLNHVGFAPHRGKVYLIRGSTSERAFQVVEAES